MNDENGSDKPWAGRFNEPTDAFVEAFTASVDFDRRLYHYDIEGSIAHATILARQGILSTAERDAIVTGLNRIRERIDRDGFFYDFDSEAFAVLSLVTSPADFREGVGRMLARVNRAATAHNT